MLKVDPHPDVDTLRNDDEWVAWMAQLRSASGLEESESEEWPGEEEWEEEEEVEVEAVLSDEQELPPILLHSPS